jgi:hypothetical protein
MDVPHRGMCKFVNESVIIDAGPLSERGIVAQRFRTTAVKNLQTGPAIVLLQNR